MPGRGEVEPEAGWQAQRHQTRSRLAAAERELKIRTNGLRNALSPPPQSAVGDGFAGWAGGMSQTG